MTNSRPQPASHLAAFRTRLQPGMLAAYRDTHSRIPEEIASALRSAGVLSWNIWCDNLTLFHTIETTHGRQQMSALMTKNGPIDPHWDALINTMVDRTPGSSSDLDLVWGMNATQQGSDRPLF